MYKLVDIGETIRRGDEMYCPDMLAWKTVRNILEGEIVTRREHPVRRVHTSERSHSAEATGNKLKAEIAAIASDMEGYIMNYPMAGFAEKLRQLSAV